MLETAKQLVEGRTPHRIVQADLTAAPDRAVRIRRDGETAVITIKGRKVAGTGVEVEATISPPKPKSFSPSPLPVSLRKTAIGSPTASL